MEFKKFYLCNKDGKSNCVIRLLCKLFNEKYDNVYSDLCALSKVLNCKSFNDIEVFEEYMKKENT